MTGYQLIRPNDLQWRPSIRTEYYGRREVTDLAGLRADNSPQKHLSSCAFVLLCGHLLRCF